MKTSISSLKVFVVLVAFTLTGIIQAQTVTPRPWQRNPPAHAPGIKSSISPQDAARRINTANFNGPSASTWTPLGPSPLNTGWSGRLAGVAVDPTNSNIIYVAGAGGGVWKTTDGGSTYTPLTDNQATLAMGAIALAPSNPSRIYAGTGEANNAGDSNFGRGILVSTDGGSTWTLSNGPGGVLDRMTVSKISVNPTNELIAYAAIGDFGENGACCSNTGIYKTTDGGTTWTNVTAANSKDSFYPWSDVVVDPNTPTTVYAAYGAYFGYSANGVYRSTDSGVTWNLLTNAPSGAATGRFALTVAPSANSAGHHVLYIAISNPATSGLYEMLRSDNADAAVPTFTNLTTTPNFLGGQG